MAIADFGNVGNFQLYDAGTYKFRVDSWERGVSSKKNTPQIRFKCTFQDGKYHGKPYTEFLNVTDASVWKVASFIVNCGVLSSSKIDTESRKFEQMCNACIGRTLYVNLEKDEAYGNNKSTSFMPDEDLEPLNFDSSGQDDAPSFVKDNINPEDIQWDK